MKTNEIRKVWYDVDNHLANKGITHDPQKLLNSMATLLCPGPFYHFIFDFGEYKFASVSDSYQELIGLDLTDLTIDKYLSRIHPDEVEYFQKCESVASYFLFQHLKPEEIKN